MVSICKVVSIDPSISAHVFMSCFCTSCFWREATSTGIRIVLDSAQNESYIWKPFQQQIHFSRKIILNFTKVAFMEAKMTRGLPRTNPAIGQGGTWTRDLRIENSALKPVCHTTFSSRYDTHLCIQGLQALKFNSLGRNINEGRIFKNLKLKWRTQ